MATPFQSSRGLELSTSRFFHLFWQKLLRVPHSSRGLSLLCADRACCSLYQRIDGLVHLPRRCPMNLDPSSVRFFRDPAKEVAESPAKQRVKISFRRAVCVELRERDRRRWWAPDRTTGAPVKASADRSRRSRRSPAAAAPFAKAQAKRSGNHQQVARFPPPTVASIPRSKDRRPIVGVIRAPVDLVDYTALGRRGKRRHGEIGIAAEIAEQGDFALEAAPPAIRA